jgi:hypothetical protein
MRKDMRADVAVRLASCCGALSFGLLQIWLHTATAGGALRGSEAEAQTWVFAVSAPLGICGLTGIGYSLMHKLAVNRVSYFLVFIFLVLIVAYWHGFWSVLQDRSSGTLVMIEVMRKWTDKLIGLQCSVIGTLAVMFLQVSDKSMGHERSDTLA